MITVNYLQIYENVEYDILKRVLKAITSSNFYDYQTHQTFSC